MRHVPAPTQALVYGGSPLLGQPGGEGARIRLSADETRRHPPIAALQVLPRSLQAAGVLRHVLNCTTVATLNWWWRCIVTLAVNIEPEPTLAIIPELRFRLTLTINPPCLCWLWVGVATGSNL